MPNAPDRYGLQERLPAREGSTKADGGGLYLEIMPTGSRYWCGLNTRYGGKEKRLACGVYPETSLAEACEKMCRSP